MKYTVEIYCEDWSDDWNEKHTCDSLGEANGFISGFYDGASEFGSSCDFQLRVVDSNGQVIEGNFKDEIE